MSERARRRSSKWDLKDDNPLSPNHIRVSGRELDKASSWDEDGGYGTRMSPGLGDWRKQRGRSPRDKWDRPARNRSRSRSRSRSPARGFRQESGNNDRYRSRSGATCKDFSAGRCRRGDDCPFIHQGNRNYDDSREGGPRRSGASKYPNTHDARDYPPGRSSSDRERRWNNVTPCKFFAAGNCRSGKLCRFSHSRASESPDRKLDDEKAMLGHNSDRAAKIWEDPRFSETVSVPDAAKFDDADGRKGASETRFDERCLDARWEQRLGPESRPIEKVIGDSDMSPDWNYGLNSSSHMEERVQHTYTIPAPEFNNESIPVKPGFSQSDMNFSANVLQLQNFEHNRQNISAIAPSSLNPVGQHDVALATDPRRERSILNPPNRGPLSEGKVVLDGLDVNKSQVTTLPPNKNMVSGEELTNISASLAQLLGAGRQLPQLYAALSATSDAPSEVPINSAIPIPLDVTIVPQKQYDPLCDSIEQQRANRPDNQQGISSSPVDSKRVVIREKEVRSSDLPSSSHADMSNNGSSKPHISTQLINQLDPGGSSDLEENMEKAVAGSKNAEESKEAKDNGQPENVDGEKKDEENKKSKEAKATRAFKFALAEFVKDLLKPAWKEGLVGKDAYKTIVKKVVDKVTGTVQGANIPQTQEKIDNYLSLSKPKLTKLVQAYVEKFQKPK